MTNLVGAILTDQLEFQKLLAAWFTVIDITLVLQYFYYTSRDKRASSSLRQSASTNISRKHVQHAHTHNHAHAHRSALPRSAHMSASYATDRSASPGTLKRLALSRTESTSSYHQQQSKRRKHYQPYTGSGSRPGSAGPSSRNHSRTSTASEPTYADIPEEGTLLYKGDGDERDVEGMRDSFHSERSKNSTASTIGESQKRGRKWSRMAHSAPLPPLSGPETGASGATTPTMRQTSISRDRDRPIVTRSRTSHSRSRSVVFLSIWAFAGLVRYSAMPGASMLGTTLLRRSTEAVPASQQPRAWKAVNSADVASAQPPDQAAAPYVDLVYPLEAGKHSDRPPHGPPVPMPDEPPIPPPSKETDMKRSIGRISAWLGVVFYLTSRMPQICTSTHAYLSAIRVV